MLSSGCSSGSTPSWSWAGLTRTTRASWSARCRESGKPVFHVQSAADLDPAWFRDFATVGLTAGTSTLPETIDESIGPWSGSAVLGDSRKE